MAWLCRARGKPQWRVRDPPSLKAGGSTMRSQREAWKMAMTVATFQHGATGSAQGHRSSLRVSTSWGWSESQGWWYLTWKAPTHLPWTCHQSTGANSIDWLMNPVQIHPNQSPELCFVLFTHKVLSNSLQLHRLQHARLPCPSPSSRVCSNSCPLSQWCHPTISSSVTPCSSCPQSFPASGSFQWVGSLHHTVKILELQLHYQSLLSLSHVQLFATPWTVARQASLFITNSRNLLKLMSIESVMPSSHLILCRPLLLLPSVFPSESVLCIRWPKYWSFSFSISPSNEYWGLISFRMDWFDLLEVQWTLKSLLQHHSSKALILCCQAFFMVQLSHLYMTTGKTVALTRWTFVGKVMFLLLNNMLFRFVIAFNFQGSDIF